MASKLRTKRATSGPEAEEPANGREGRMALDALNGMCGGNAAGTYLTTVAQSVAAECAILARNQFHSLLPSFIAGVNEEIERPVQRHWPEVPRAQGDERASRIAGCAVDALWLMVQRPPFLAVMRDPKEIVLVEILPWDHMWKRSSVSRKERFQIDRKIAHDGQITQRLNSQTAANSVYECAARQSLPPIDDHGTRSAHANAAGKSKPQVRTRATLKSEQHIQHACLLGGLELMRFPRCGAARPGGVALDADRDFRH